MIEKVEEFYFPKKENEKSQTNYEYLINYEMNILQNSNSWVGTIQSFNSCKNIYVM